MLHVEPSDVELARFETDDTDGLITCGILSTTQESFSEHAWDPYQVCDAMTLSGVIWFRPQKLQLFSTDHDISLSFEVFTPTEQKNVSWVRLGISSIFVVDY